MNSFRFRLVRMVCTIIFSSIIVLLFRQALYAQTPIKQLLTNEGVLAIRPGKGKECYDCQGLFLNGKQILHDQYVYIDAAYPSFEDPQLITVSLSSGGNCCAPTTYILDFSVKPHLSVEGVGFDKDIARSENGVVFTQNAGTDKLGDRLLGVYEYVWGSGKVNLKKSTPQYSIGPLSKKQYPDDVLSDPIMREPLFKLLGDKYFATFRIATLVSDKLEIIDDKFVIGSGCQPHNCPFNFAMFIIDVRRKLAWAAAGEETLDGHKGARLWGIIGNKDEFLLREIGHWLIDNKIPLDSITHVSLPPSVSRLYALNSDSDVNYHTTEISKDAGKVAIVLNSDGPQHKVLAPVELFNLLAPSIYVVSAMRVNGDEFQGSAVAISSTVLLTNCHVVIDSSSITMTQKDMELKVYLVSADVEADRCVLKSDRPLSHYVPIRPYDDLKIGERVYSIGAPAGLELTMTDGLLSGKRTISERHLVQNSAPISPGSSGGGLFDEAGNLIGITTFRLKDTENLNFAISAEDYLLR